MAEWMPIETAPKDGSTVLVGCAVRVGVAAHVAPGRRFRGKPWRANGQWGEQLWWEPTHWMPLPEPPK